MLAALVGSAGAVARCGWKSEAHGATFDLAPIGDAREIKLGSALSILAGMGPRGAQQQPEQSIIITPCSELRAAADPACGDERAPGILIERPPSSNPMHSISMNPLLESLLKLNHGRRQTSLDTSERPARCTILGRRSSPDSVFSLLDPKDPGKGLQARFEKGDECRPGQRYSILLMLQCDLSAQGTTSRMPARIQKRNACEWVVSLSSAAACPVNVGERCAPNCPRTWLGDGECDPGCDSAGVPPDMTLWQLECAHLNSTASCTACNHDGGDCSEPALKNSRAQLQCAPGCEIAWRGDRECDEECDNAACQFDGGDCAGMCAPGWYANLICMPSMNLCCQCVCKQ